MLLSFITTLLHALSRAITWPFADEDYGSYDVETCWIPRRLGRVLQRTYGWDVFDHHMRVADRCSLLFLRIEWKYLQRRDGAWSFRSSGIDWPATFEARDQHMLFGYGECAHIVRYRVAYSGDDLPF